jgi:hypothetical protein
MRRLVLTISSPAAGGIKHADLADLVIALERRLVWGPPLSQGQCDAYFTARTTPREGLPGRIIRPCGGLNIRVGKILGDRVLRVVRLDRTMDRPERAVEPDFPVGLPVRPRAIGVEDESGPGRCEHRRSWIETTEKAEMAPRPDCQRIISTRPTSRGKLGERRHRKRGLTCLQRI